MQQLQIYRPIRSSTITQRFYDNSACVYPNGRVVGKTNPRCPAGSKDFYESIGMKGHGALDIAAIIGENVLHSATFDGWMKTEVDNGGGIGVDIVSNEPLFFNANEVPDDLKPLLDVAYFNDRKGYLSYIKERHWHLKSALGYDGKQVTFGQIIGLAGNTGASSGPHDHFAFKWCDKNGYPIARYNGYLGSFDFSPFYKHEEFAGDVANQTITPEERIRINEQLSLVTRLLLGVRELLTNKST